MKLTIPKPRCKTYCQSIKIELGFDVAARKYSALRRKHPMALARYWYEREQGIRDDRVLFLDREIAKR